MFKIDSNVTNAKSYYFFVQVLILEPTKVYQPSYVSINNEAEEMNVSIWHVSPAETVRTIYVCTFLESIAKGDWVLMLGSDMGK